MASRAMLYRGLGVLVAVAVAGCTASPASSPGHARSAPASALTAASPGAASGSAPAGPGGARALAVSPDMRNELTVAFADYKRIPPSDVAGISGSVYYAYDPATDTHWALANFLPSLRAPSQVLVGFQDGASIGLFTRFANGSWQVQLGGAPPICAEVAFFPPAVLTAWSLPADTAGFQCSAPPAQSVFAASFSFMSAHPGRGDGGERIALLSSRTGHLVRWLTPRQDGTSDAVLSVHDGWVYFLRSRGTSVATWRVRVTGGPAQLVQAGYTPSAVSPDGRVVASVVSTDHGDVVELVARNLVTGRQNTIIMATNPDGNANNWPPGISSLSWAPDDTHLAVQFTLTAAINSVLVFDAFTAMTIRDGRTAPAPCLSAAGNPVCGEFDPAYLASGALTYVVQQVSSSGAASASLEWWQAGYQTILLSFPADAGSYDMTAQGQAIWVSGPPQPKGPWTIWRWSGGAPVKITTLPPLGVSPYYGVLGIAW